VSLRERLLAHGVSAERLDAMGMTESPSAAETAAVAAVNAEAEAKHDAECLDLYVRYVAADPFAKARIRATHGDTPLARGRSLLGGK
jgi:hypothetical protein